MLPLTESELVSLGRMVAAGEAEALAEAAGRLGENFANAARVMASCKGRVVVTGLGKSGHVGRKVSSTLASLGTPSFFLHAAEASHGDLGMVLRGDVGLFVSNSGATPELLPPLAWFRRIGASVIAITGGTDSELARRADVVIDSGVRSEADPLGLAPTSSTAVQMAMGDALAVAAARLRGFGGKDFAALHPGGTLGRRLLTRVSDLCEPGGERLPKVSLDVSVRDALFEITEKKYGATCVVDEDGALAGIFTDGDLRRLMERHGVEALNMRIGDCMTRNAVTIEAGGLAADAAMLMEEREISVVIAVHGQKPVGMLHVHDLMRYGIV
ncbi:MAG: KpsF/GutQ family sugar-phosphate isomerase [Synergistaceae bacterium]|jgi:arabinose-5-phosphate isomerase|nr:KpsF/GutQ family sugar-phosphate isomerase [Synergistaceae bacterium]